GWLGERHGHCRRYEKPELVEKLVEAGYDVEAVHWMNAVGMVGWFVNARLLKHETIPPRHVKVFEGLIPAVRLVDGVATRLFGGLSLIAVARRPRNGAAVVERSARGTMAVPR